MKLDLKIPDKLFGLESALLILFLQPLLLVGLFFLSLKYIIIPRVDEITQVKSEINKTLLSTNKLNDQVAFLASVDQEELKKNTEYLDSAVLRDKKSYLLVEIIRKVADKYDYSIEGFSLTPGEIKEEEERVSLKNMIKMPVSLVLYGPEEKTLELLLALEKTLPILFIDSYKTANIKNTTKLDLTVSSYYLPESSDANTNIISLNDLILSKEESALVEKISDFIKIDLGQDNTQETEFKKYDRKNPFNL